MHDMADTTAPAAEHADRPAKPRLSIDAKWIVTTVIGIGLLQLTLVGMMFQQNAMLMQQYATVNARIDDTNTSVNARMDQMQTDMRELRTEMHTDIRDLRTEIREMRSLLLQLLERTAPATPAD